MDNRKKSLVLLVFSGLSGIVFLTLLTSSFYGYVLQKIGVEHAEKTNTYKYHYVMIINNLDSQFWSDYWQVIGNDSQESTAVTLQVPSDYTGFGNKQGTVTFWAEAAE